MKYLSNIYTKIIIGVFVLGLISAGGVNYYTKVQSDARYNKVADNVDPIATGLIYSSGAVDTLLKPISFENQLKLMYGFSGDWLPVGASSGMEVTVSLNDARSQGLTFVTSKQVVAVGVYYVVKTAPVGATLDNKNGVKIFGYNGATGLTTDIVGGEIAFVEGSPYSVGRHYVTFATPITIPAGEYKLEIAYNQTAGTPPVFINCGRIDSGAQDYLFNSANRISYYRTVTTTFGTGFNLMAGTSAESVVPLIWIDLQ